MRARLVRLVTCHQRRSWKQGARSYRSHRRGRRPTRSWTPRKVLMPRLRRSGRVCAAPLPQRALTPPPTRRGRQRRRSSRGRRLRAQQCVQAYGRPRSITATSLMMLHWRRWLPRPRRHPSGALVRRQPRRRPKQRSRLRLPSRFHSQRPRPSHPPAIRTAHPRHRHLPLLRLRHRRVTSRPEQFLGARFVGERMRHTNTTLDTRPSEPGETWEVGREGAVWPVWLSAMT